MLKSNNLDLSSTGGKLPPHGPRRVLVPSRKFSDPYVLSVRRQFPVSDQEKRHYNAICKLSESSKWHRYSFLYIYFYSFCIMHVSYFAFLFISFFCSYDAVDIDNVRAKFSSFGQSLMKGGTVLSYVINVFCRVLFNNNHPSNSKRHYFFSSIGVSSYFSNLCFFLLMLICYIFFGMFISLLIFFQELLLTDLSCADLSKVKRSFLGAASARKLHLSDMVFFLFSCSCKFSKVMLLILNDFLQLFFPIEHLEHWFLFVVDIKDRMLVLLDSLHEKGDPYFEDIECLLV